MGTEFIVNAHRPTSKNNTIGITIFFSACWLFFFTQDIPDASSWSIVVAIYSLRYMYNQGLSIDFGTRKFREYKSFLYFQYGDWHTLPPITNILLYANRVSNAEYSEESWGKTGKRENIYKLTLFNTDTDFELLVCQTSDEGLVMRTAHELTTWLGLELDRDIRL
jgi:hypothetical protein